MAMPRQDSKYLGLTRQLIVEQVFSNHSNKMGCFGRSFFCYHSIYTIFVLPHNILLHVVLFLNSIFFCSSVFSFLSIYRFDLVLYNIIGSPSGLYFHCSFIWITYFHFTAWIITIITSVFASEFDSVVVFLQVFCWCPFGSITLASLSFSPVVIHYF